MPEAFDPYEAWLGIPAREQPPDHYRLLGVQRFEHNPELIQQAAQQRVAQLKPHQTGPRAEACRRLLREIAAAKSCLLNEQRRAAYDRALLESAVKQAARAHRRPESLKVGAGEFLDLLDEKDLLPDELLLSLRRRLLEIPGPVSAEKVAALLIRKGLLTPVLARRLLASAADAGAGKAAGTSRQSPPSTSAQAPASTANVEPSDSAGEELPAHAAPPGAEQGESDQGELDLKPLEEELGLAPLEEEQQEAGPWKEQATGKVADEGSLRPAKPPAQQLHPADEGGQARKTADAHGPSAGTPTGGEPGSLLDEELPPLDSGEAGPLGDLLSESAAQLEAAPTLSPMARRRGLSARLAQLCRSPWFLTGAAAASILLIAVLAICRVLASRRAAQALPEAEAHWRNGHYAEAVALFDDYFSWHAAEPQGARVRVLRVRAALHQMVESRAPVEECLAAAAEMLPEVAYGRAYDEQAAADVALLLSQLAERAVAQARARADPSLLDQAKSAAKLIDRFARPAAVRGNMPARIEQACAQAAHDLQRAEASATALTAFEQARTKADPHAAEEAILGLLAEYPELAGDEKLQQAQRRMSELWQQAVKWVDKPAQSGPASDMPPAGTVVFCRRVSARPESGQAHRPLLVAAADAVWALDAASGRVLWQRPLCDAEPQTAVLLGVGEGGDVDAGDPPGGCVVLADQARGELLGVEPANGRLRWRLGIEQPVAVAHSALAGSAIAATRDGLVVAVDLTSGRVQGGFQLPASIQAAPVVDAVHGMVFQPAHEGRLLFVLDLEQKRCVQVVTTQHPADRLLGPVTGKEDRLLLAASSPADGAALLVYGIAEGTDRRGPLRMVQRISLEGTIQTAPLSVADEVLVVMRSGRASLFRWDENGRLEAVLADALSGQEQAPRAVRLSGERIWVAGGPLRVYRIDRPRKRLLLESLDPTDKTAIRLAPLGDGRLCCMCCWPELPGAEVLALPASGDLDAQSPFSMPETDSQQARRPGETDPWQWKTELGVPLLSDSLTVMPDGRSLAVNSAGAVFVWRWTQGDQQPGTDSQSGAGGASSRSPQASGAERACELVVELVVAAEDELPEGRFRWAVRRNDLLVFFSPQLSTAWSLDLENNSCTLQRVELPGVPAAEPVAWGEHVLLPTTDGALWLVDPRRGSTAAAPLQGVSLRRARGGSVHWRLSIRAGHLPWIRTGGSGNCVLSRSR